MRKLLSRLPVTFTAQALLYPLFLVLSLIFAQLLRRPVSYMLFVFVLFLPIATVVWLIFARLCIRVVFRPSETTVNKHTTVRFYVCVTNKCPLPFAFVTARMSLPDKRGMRCETKDFTMALLPFCSCRIEEAAEFAFRGAYHVGVECLYVCDLFHAVRIRIPCECGADISVLARRLELPRHAHIKTMPDGTRIVGGFGGNSADTADTRLYEIGDSVRRIHWKLSSKSEELIVKDYTRAEGTDVIILCDLEPHYEKFSVRRAKAESADIVDLCHADIVVEAAIAAVTRELSAGNSVMLAYMENDAPTAFILRSAADLDEIYPRFAAVPLCACEHQPALLSGCLSDSVGTAPVLVTPYLDDAAVAEYAAIADTYKNAAGSELILCTADSLFEPDPEYDRSCREWMARLAAAGYTVTDAAKIFKK
ncbi:MAG: DUF58 domain-containing protein [Clostridia bacterium]|nr:DUF58 domain-containing protein [Clostridia bacterium]